MSLVDIGRFEINKGLGYLIQNVTGDPTNEILGYFHSIAVFVMNDLFETSNAMYLTKDVVLFYKDTSISYRLRINTANKKFECNREAKSRIEVTYPNEQDTVDVAELVNSTMESDLGLTNTNSMSAFDIPTLKSPRCLKKVRIAQREQRTKQ
jgi:hypothetical protein